VTVRIGTSGWSYRSWRGPFFPREVMIKHHLQFYATQFSTAELNGVFYRTPTVEAVRAWRDGTPDDFIFAWKACRAAKSNAILLARDGASVGIGMGQVNRVDSCRLAVSRAGDRASGSVAASDAFFPFEDGPQILIDAGVSAIVQPGGSVRDELTMNDFRAQRALRSVHLS